MTAEFSNTELHMEANTETQPLREDLREAIDARVQFEVTQIQLKLRMDIAYLENNKRYAFQPLVIAHPKWTTLACQEYTEDCLEEAIIAVQKEEKRQIQYSLAAGETLKKKLDEWLSLSSS